MAGLFQTGFKEGGVDVGDIYLEKATLIDVYPYLIDSVKSAGLWGWGSGAKGTLGDNTIVSKSSPVQTVAGGTNWKQVSADVYYTAAIKTDGTLWLWGDNEWGQLGDNTIGDKSSPVQTIAGGTDWKSVSFGDRYCAAIKTDGTLWLWGDNVYGQLGTGNTTNRSSPVQTVAGGTNWKQVSSSNHTAAIKTDGTLWIWGRGDVGQIGNSTANQSSPVQTITGGTNWKQVSSGGSHTVAVKTDGTLWVWGYNVYGQLGTGNTTNRSSPVQTVAGGTNWKQVAAGYDHTATIKTDGTLWACGYNLFGQLGTGNTTNRSSPVQTVAGGTNWKQVAAGDFHTAAIKTDGTLWAWGKNEWGQLGDNTIGDKSSPVQTISGGSNWRTVSAGSAHIFAIREGDDF